MQQMETLEYPFYWNIYDRIFMIVHQQGMTSNMLRSVVSQAATMQQDIMRIWSWPVTCSARNVEELGELMQKGETYNSPDMSKDGWKHLTPSLLEEVDCPRCNNADTDW